jgi:hypothetical protein
MLRSKPQWRGCSRESIDRTTPTIAHLASEAELSRATLNRVPELLDRFRAALEQHNGDNTTALPNPDRIGELEAEIAMLRGRESDEMRDLGAEHGPAHSSAQPARP